MKQNISILGCGWLGMPLSIKLSEIGYKVKGSTTSKNKLSILNSMKIEPYLINLDTSEINSYNFYDSEILIIAVPSKNIRGFQELVTRLEISAVRKVLFISSTSVYKNSAVLVTEDSPLEFSPLVEIENLFVCNSNFDTTIIRFGGLIGYDRNPGNFFPEGKIIDNPDGFVNMIHRDDCIHIIEQIIKNKIWNQTINACAETHPTRREFYTTAATKLGRIAPKFNEDTKTSTKIVSSEKLKALIDINFSFPNLLEI